MINKQPFWKLLDTQPFLIVAHRGSRGGSIIENTTESKRVALLQHADIVELDIVQSTDGDFFVFHDGQEKRLLNESRNLKELSTSEIEAKNYYNSIGEPVDRGVERFSVYCKHLQADTFINIDRSWFYWDDFLPFLDQFPNLHDHFLLKSPLERQLLEKLSQHDVNYLYFPIVDSIEQLRILRDFPELNLIGIELNLTKQNWDLLESPELKRYKNEHFMFLANAMKLSGRSNLFNGLDENIALLDDPDKSWGVMLKRGMNAIQTDWSDILNDYRTRFEETKKVTQESDLNV